MNSQLEVYKKEILMDQMEKPHAVHDMHEMKKETSMVKKLQFALNAKSGSSAIGMVMFTEENGEVTLEAHINGLTPGVHAIHVHEKADCSSEDGKSNGGHWNPTFSPHGAWGSEKVSIVETLETMPMKQVTAVTFSTNLWCLDCMMIQKT